MQRRLEGTKTRIFITTMDEPLYTNPFIRRIIERRKKDIVGVAVSKGTPLTTKRKTRYFEHVLAVSLIMGLPYTLKHFLKTIAFLIQERLSTFLGFIKSPSIAAFAAEQGIPSYRVASVNSETFLTVLRNAQPDIIINQAQEILKKKFLEIPKIGCLNRHNAILPRNRGRFSPFWVILRNEEETGVSIHYVIPKIDAGDIIVQKKIAIAPNDTFMTITEKCYRLAPAAMLEAIDRLETGKYEAMSNDPSKGNYNPLPSLKHALQYRGLMQMRKRTHHA